MAKDPTHKCEYKFPSTSCDSCSSKKGGCKAVSTLSRMGSGTVPLIVIQISTSFFPQADACITQARSAAAGSPSPAKTSAKVALVALHRV